LTICGWTKKDCIFTYLMSCYRYFSSIFDRYIDFIEKIALFLLLLTKSTFTLQDIPYQIFLHQDILEFWIHRLFHCRSTSLICPTHAAKLYSPPHPTTYRHPSWLNHSHAPISSCLIYPIFFSLVFLRLHYL
jgi:hypothetical protein